MDGGRGRGIPPGPTNTRRMMIKFLYSVAITIVGVAAFVFAATFVNSIWSKKRVGVFVLLALAFIIGFAMVVSRVIATTIGLAVVAVIVLLVIYYFFK